MSVNRSNTVSGIVGILLAAGRSDRFGGDKPLPCSRWRGIGACGTALLTALTEVVAVVRPNDAALAAALGANGAHIVRCASADKGMGESLACAVRARPGAAGWIVALADMPWIETATIVRVANALADGALIAAPFHRGMRGHPVGFGKACYAALAALTGDEGAKTIVAAHRDSVTRIDVDDAGILRDVDTREDLA
jgi:molybdenum cofactor cytidylyltransferase